MDDVVQKRLEFVIAAENETAGAMTAVETSLRDLSRLAESLTAAFWGIVPAVEAAQTAIRGVGESGTKSMSEFSESVARVNNTAWENLARGATYVANEIKAEFEKAGRAIEEALTVSVPTPKVGTTGGGTPPQKGGGGIFSNEGSMNLLYGGMSIGAMAAPAAAGLAKALEDFKSFEKQMSAVNAMLGLSQDQFRGLEQQVISLSGVLPSTSEELASGLYSAVGAGYSLSDSLDVVKVASEAAAAGQTDMNTATGLLTSVLQAYGMQASEVTKVADELFGANSAARASFDDFARSLGTVIGPAANAGVSFGVTAAALGALTNTGLSAQQSAEDLRSLLMGIVSPTKQAQKEAAALWIEWDQAALKSKGLKGMLDELMKAANGNNDIISKIAGTEAAFTAATNLAGKGAGSFKAALEAVAGSAGATHKAMQAIEQTPTFKLDEFGKSIQNLGLQIWLNAAPGLARLAEVGQRVIDWFNGLSPRMKEVVSFSLVLGTAFVVLSAGAMMFLSAIGQARLGLAVLTEAFGFFRAGAIASIRAVGFALMTNPMLAGVMVAITAVALLVYVIVTHWTQIKTWTVNTFNAVKDWIVAKWDEVVMFFSQLPERIWNFLKHLPEDMFRALGEMVGYVVLGTPKLVAEMANGAANMLHAFGVWIS